LIADKNIAKQFDYRRLQSDECLHSGTFRAPNFNRIIFRLQRVAIPGSVLTCRHFSCETFLRFFESKDRVAEFARTAPDRIRASAAVRRGNCCGEERLMKLFDVVFGCSHKRCSFPITVRGKQRRSAAASVTGTYVVCLDCGQEFAYDWNEMKMVDGKSAVSLNPAPVYTGPKAA
jgi:hypothetical protein